LNEARRNKMRTYGPKQCMHAQEKKSIRAVCVPRLGSAIVDNKKRKRGINHKDDAEELNAEGLCWIAACACHAGRDACRKESRKRYCSTAAGRINDEEIIRAETYHCMKNSGDEETEKQGNRRAQRAATMVGIQGEARGQRREGQRREEALHTRSQEDGSETRARRTRAGKN